MSVRYCGRDFSDEELSKIRQLIAANPACHRAQLSRMPCEILRWYKADGGPKAMSARVAMLRMQDDGLITLPPPRRARPDPTVRLTAHTAPGTPIERPAGALRPLVGSAFSASRNHAYGTSSSNATTILATSPCPVLSCAT